MAGIYGQLMKVRHFEVVDPILDTIFKKWPKCALLYTLLQRPFGMRKFRFPKILVVRF